MGQSLTYRAGSSYGVDLCGAGSPLWGRAFLIGQNLTYGAGQIPVGQAPRPLWGRLPAIGPCRRGADPSPPQPMEIFVDDETKLTLHGLQQYYVKLKDNEKNRKLFDLLDVLEFNQVRGGRFGVGGAPFWGKKTLISEQITPRSAGLRCGCV